MATLKTRTTSTDRHRRIHIQSGGRDSVIQNPNEEYPKPQDQVPVPQFVAEIPPVENASAKPVSDLALELVLNEIVLQARLTTNATGAVIALENSRNLVCRATTGATSSEIAAFLNIPSGASARCFETGAVRRIDDIEPGSHADAAAYQRAGVRSILVVPISDEEDHILGIVQSFSPRPGAFCERDVLTLQALARRVATNIELVKKRGTFATAVATAPLPQPNDISVQQTAPRARFQFRTPQFFTRLLSTRIQLLPVSWRAVLGRAALFTALLAVCVVAGELWIRSQGISLSGVAAVHRSSQAAAHPAASPPANAAVANTVRPEINRSDAPRAVSTNATSSKEVSPSSVRLRRRPATSITIERKPIHKDGDTSTVGEKIATEKPHSSTGEIVLFEDQGSASQKEKTQQLNSSKDSGVGGVEAISTQDAMARLVQRIEPEYPNAARQKHIQGDVLLDVVVNQSGVVDELALVSGDAQLMPAAEQAVRQWHFQPLIKGGHPKKFKSRIGINFTLAFGGSSQGR